MSKALATELELSRLLRDEIQARDLIPFARFWDLALYHPRLGYYEQAANPIGAGGDFITSVSVGPMFGRLLAGQFSQWLDTMAGPRQILEAGAHHGELARDLLTALPAQGQHNLEYWILEPSARRRVKQEATLKDFLPQVRWFATWETLAERSVTGIIFANELLDAFPCPRFGWDALGRVWFEWGIGWDGHQFVWGKLPGNPNLHELVKPYLLEPSLGVNSVVDIAAGLQTVLPHEFTLEINAAVESWWRRAAQRLKTGRLLTVDYGFETEEFFQPSRRAGTLRSFRRHHFAADCLAHPGAQDITAAVNFSLLKLAGESMGLLTVGYESQARFLTRIIQLSHPEGNLHPAWTPPELRQFKTLIHPEHLGRAFQVFVQQREPGSRP